MPDLPADVYRKSLDCVHCGLCLNACPTYLVTGREASSPRGRIYLMRGVAEGKIPLGDLVAEEAFLCVGCRACETACPSGVEFGAMLELTRDAVDAAGLRAGWGRRLERVALRGIIPRRWRLRVVIGLLGLAQRLKLDRLALRLGPGARIDDAVLENWLRSGVVGGINDLEQALLAGDCERSLRYWETIRRQFSPPAVTWMLGSRHLDPRWGRGRGAGTRCTPGFLSLVLRECYRVELGVKRGEIPSTLQAERFEAMLWELCQQRGRSRSVQQQQ